MGMLIKIVVVVVERKLRSVSVVNVLMYIHTYSKDIPIYYVTARSDAHTEEVHN